MFERGHAFLVQGSAEVVPQIMGALGREANDPDVYARTYRNFGIDEARDLRSRANSRALKAGSRRIFIIACTGITAEAQNALLKTLEEPPADALFVFIVPSPHALLSTVRSRMQMVEVVPSKSRVANQKIEAVDAKEFLTSSQAERLEMLKPLFDRDENEERDIGGAIVFLASLEEILGSHIENTEGKRGVEAIYRARKYMSDKGALMKPLLEQVALLVPRV